MKYYTADTHFSHGSILRYQNRPFADIEEMNRALLQNWNERVKCGDEVYILGDFSFAGGEETNALLQRLSGQKFLLRGNHDRFLNDKAFDTSLFVWIRDYAKIKDGKQTLVLFHYPIAAWDGQDSGALHLYGHIHDDLHAHYPAFPYPQVRLTSAWTYADMRLLRWKNSARLI